MLKTLTRSTLMASLAAIPFAAPVALADEAPEAGSTPLSEIIASVEDAGYDRISEVSMEDGVWEIDAYKGDDARELEVDPQTGEILSDEED